MRATLCATGPRGALGRKYNALARAAAVTHAVAKKFVPF